MDKILVFIPMYNCEKQIPRVISQISPCLQEFISEVLILDNGSTDKSLIVAQKAIATLNIKASVRKNVNNYNLGGSHKVAFNYAKDIGYDYVIVLHGDDQGNIQDLLPYLEKGEHKKLDCLLGSRFSLRSKLIGYSKIRILANICFNILYSLACLKKICDLGSGLNIYNIKSLQGDFYLKFPNSLVFNVYLLLYFVNKKFRMCFIPITWREDDQVSNAKLFKVGSALLKICIRYVIDRKRLLHKSNNNEEKINYNSNLIGKNTSD